MTGLSGIFPPIPTPFSREGEVDLPALAVNLDWWNGFPLSGYVVLGSNGEAVHLEEEEKLRVVGSVRARVPEGRMLIAGSSELSTRATIHSTRKMHDAGADHALILPPYYYKPQMTSEALDRHFRTVADASPIPIVLYNMPANTGVALEAGLVIRLAEHENIAGLKDSGGDLVWLAEIRHNTRPEFSVLAGSASFLLPALALGANGTVPALANIAPQQCLDIYQKASHGDVASVQSLQLAMIEPNTAVTRR